MPVDKAIRQEIVKEFGDSDLMNDEVIEKLNDLKTIFHIEFLDLFVEWESFNVAVMSSELEMNLANLEKFQEHLQSSLANSKSTPSGTKKVRDAQASSIKKRPIMKASGILNSSPVAPSTPNLKKRKVEEPTPAFKTPRANFNESSPMDFDTANNTFQLPSDNTPLLNKLTNQQESNTIIETLNPNIEELPGFIQLEEDPTTSIKPYKLINNFDVSKYKYRTMSMKLLESADVLDDQIDTFARLYSESQGSKGTIEFGNPCLSSQFDIICSGRIVPDSPTYDKSGNHLLNSTSLFLETSRMSGIGQRIPLDLTQLSGYSFFPGQIVILKGSNPTGRSFVVREVLHTPELGAPVTPRRELEDYEELIAQSGLKLVVAAGPFSNRHTLNYSKLEKLTELINTKLRPHVVILNGPFVDITNAAVESGEIELPDEKQTPRNLDEVFKKTISPILKKIDPRIQVVLIPSLKDASIKHCSYPQDVFDRKKFGLPKNVRVVPNPSSFSVNEVLIGSSNLDVFKDLKDVYQGDAEGKIFNNRFERITNHIFDQRRYYPSFPGSVKTNIGGQSSPPELHDGIMGDELSVTEVGGSSLEVPYLGLTELGDSLPDILIIPSELKFFVKVIKGVVVINPGYYIKSSKDSTREDGTYAVIGIKAPELQGEDKENVEPVDSDSDLYYHNVHKRARVDIYKS
ncbi:DNA polymerase alpha-primase complex B subunit [Scheffersomyces xylosifermentans]|uniref:DNA polymerase alpha-primase complex B subunit n=1 Tax=Scheffersomyces xylosifermentans TaxID=1304137 RepID=UPI00315DBF98